MDGEVRVFGLGFSSDRFIVPSHAGWNRLVFAPRGSGLLRTPAGWGMFDAHRGFWIGQDVAAEILATARLDLRIAYVRPFERLSGCVAMTPLARELVERAVERGWLDPASAPDRRMLSVLFDELHALGEVTQAIALPVPRDPRGLRVAGFLNRFEPRLPLPMAELAESCGCSVRTLERIFIRETGFGVIAWQRRLRLVTAASALASGCTVTEAGLEAGYADTSAFVTAFRRAFGMTPGRLRVTSHGKT